MNLRLTIGLVLCIITVRNTVEAQNKKPRIIFKSNDFFAIRETVTKYIKYYEDIPLIHKGMIEKLNEEDFRQLFDSSLNDFNAKEVIPQDFPDTSDMQIVNAEKKLKMNLQNYTIEIGAAIGYNSFNFIQDCYTTPLDSVCYCIQDTLCNAWIKKTIFYLSGDKENSITTITRLTLIKRKQGSGIIYRISDINFDDKFPEDKDNDHIADNKECDYCNKPLPKNTTNYITTHGCVKNIQPPSSLFAISFGVGAAFAENNESIERSIYGGDAIVKPTYFTKTGFSVEMNGVYTPFKWFGFKYGFMYTHNNINNARLESELNSFLLDNGYKKHITFNSTSRQLLMQNLSVRIGNFNNAKSILYVEATIAFALTNLSILNKDIQYTISGDSLNPTPIQSHLSFKSSPFTLYGGKINYEFSPNKDGKGRFYVSVFYLNGNYSFGNQEIMLSTGNKIVFQAGRIDLFGVTGGFYFNLKTSKQWKDIEGYKLLSKEAETYIY